MICFPNAKINLGLQITQKRADGYHNICSIFYPVGWSDAIEIIPSSSFEFSQSGISILGKNSDNLVVSVYKWMKEKFDLPFAKIHLHKNIPVGAGLGGGSADAAFTMKMLNEIFELGLKNEEMQGYIKSFGSDCAFFIDNRPTLAIEKGDVFQEITLSLKNKYLILIYPDLFISTPEAYAGVVPEEADFDLKLLFSVPLKDWKNLLFNDFEKNIFQKYALLKSIKYKLYEMGAAYASMSGSGSTIYGIFEKPVSIAGQFPTNYKIWTGMLD